MSEWTTSASADLYNVPNWAHGFFEVADSGHVAVRPDGGLAPGEPTPGEPTVDLYDLIGQVRRRGIQTPLIVRFDGILRARVREINARRSKTREDRRIRLRGRRTEGVFPIKVNQQRHVVEALLAGGERYGMGLEVGSKPELLAAIALKSSREMLVICNGYKDSEYVETALLASKLGMTTILVIEKFTELDTILRASKALGVRPTIGVRTKLWGKGSGRWMESGGDRSKFGLTSRQIVQVVEALEAEGMLDTLGLLHFHLGSQVTEIRALKNALREATRTLTALHDLGVRVRWFDVGGGLGIDYDGSRTSSESSRNYSLDEYADDVVYHLKEACREGGVPEPIIVSESGRALTAHHAVLVTEVLGVTDFATPGAPLAPEPGEHDAVRRLSELFAELHIKNYLASFHDAQQFRDEAMLSYSVGQLDLRGRARVEELYWRICTRILDLTNGLEYVPDDVHELGREMAATYFLNFSVFQSIPDSWAIQQLFPILPLHRLDEQPTERAILADITCDSDGKIDRFVSREEEKRTLELHRLEPGEPYYVGIFLVGAYQEILGDMHNLFGDPNIVHVDLDEQGRPVLTHVRARRPHAGDPVVRRILRRRPAAPAAAQHRARDPIRRDDARGVGALAGPLRGRARELHLPRARRASRGGCADAARHGPRTQRRERGAHVISAGALALALAVQATAFENVTVVPMDAPGLLEGRTVVVEGDRITAIGAHGEVSVPAGAVRIAGEGRYLLPGLCDMHVHAWSDDDLLLFVANGVTTVRNMFGSPMHLSWREDIAQGERVGPTFLTGGPIVDGDPPVWPNSTVVTTADEGRAAVAEQAAAGYDFVKVYARLPLAAYDAIAAAARESGLPVMGHVPTAVGLERALAAGQRTIEHLDGYAAWLAREDSPLRGRTDLAALFGAWEHVADDRFGDAVERTVAAGTWNCPTLIVLQKWIPHDEFDAALEVPEMRYVSPFMVQMWRGMNGGMSEEVLAAGRAGDANRRAFARALFEGGAKLVLGTDQGNPFVVAGFSVHDELRNLVECGLTPWDALRTATRAAAECVGAEDEFGSIAVGLRADLVLLEANPLEDVAHAARRAGVLLRGRWYPAAELDERLAELEARYAPAEAGDEEKAGD